MMERKPQAKGSSLTIEGSGRSRRSQVERTTDMRRRICEATLETLCAIGFDRLSLAMVAARAGISKGAITHHFSCKSDILVGAFEHMIAQWQQERVAFNAGHPEATLEDYLRFIWEKVFNQPTYIAAIDLMLAARADAELQSRLRAVLGDWMIVRDELSKTIIGPDVAGIPRAIYVQVSLSMMRGMAIHESINVDGQTNAVLIEAWIDITKKLLSGSAPVQTQDLQSIRSSRGKPISQASKVSKMRGRSLQAASRGTSG